MTRLPAEQLFPPPEEIVVPDYLTGKVVVDGEPGDMTELHYKVHQYRVMGASLRQIAKLLDISPMTAARYEKVATSFFATLAVKDATELRSIAAARYESIIAAHWNKAMSGTDKAAAQIVLAAQRELCKLHGLNKETDNSIPVVQSQTNINLYNADAPLIDAFETLLHQYQLENAAAHPAIEGESGKTLDAEFTPSEDTEECPD